MGQKKSTVSRISSMRLVGVALLAGSAAGCSSDSSRFMYYATDNLTTASVGAPASGGLRPVGEIPNVSSQNNQQYNQPQYGQAQYNQPQAFPGDLRQPSVDTGYTASIPGAVTRSSATSSSILGASTRSAGNLIDRTSLPKATAALGAKSSAARIAVASAVKPVTMPSVQMPSVAMPAEQAFPSRPTATNAQLQTASIAREMSPDPIVTGTTGTLQGDTRPQGNGWTTAGGTRVTLGEGETLYNLSKRYGVPVNEIMKANQISDASKVRAGQGLIIPLFVYSRGAPVSAPDSNPKVMASRASTGMRGEVRHDRLPVPQESPDRQTAILPNGPALRSNEAANKSNGSDTQVTASASNSPTSAGGSYVVKSGDTLNRIAYAHGVGVDDLKQANGLSKSMIQVGQKLKIPAAGSAGAAAADPVVTASVKPDANKPSSYSAPKEAAKTDSLTETAKTDAGSSAPQTTGIEKLRWPVRGQVITGFAKTENGRRNDGLDLSVPVGTPVKAAENGVVIYSGNGLKEYGNTVLVRHEDGLVTVYANASELNVKRGDKVKRGQVIAASGMSGVAKTPRLHFEVRKNATPVNPTTYLE